jgi:hypothetical protein
MALLAPERVWMDARGHSPFPRLVSRVHARAHAARTSPACAHAEPALPGRHLRRVPVRDRSRPLPFPRTSYVQHPIYFWNIEMQYLQYTKENRWNTCKNTWKLLQTYATSRQNTSTYVWNIYNI